MPSLQSEMTMNRRTFLQTSSAAATAVSLIPGTLLQAAESKHVNWPVGCFNRPWNEKKNFGLDAALDGMKAAGYKIAGLLRRDAKDPLTGSDATKEYLESLKKRIAARGLTVNMAALRDKHDLPLDDQIKDMRKQIENAAFIVAKFGLTFGVDSPKHYDNYCKLMQDAAPFAQDHGVKLVLKPHGGATSAADEISQFMEKVNHPNFKIWFDAGNIIFYTGKDPVTELKPIVQHVTGFCAKDCD